MVRRGRGLWAIAVVLGGCPLLGQIPSSGQSSLALADSYLRSGRYADAIALLAPMEQAQGNDPKNDSKLEWLLGNALIRAGRLPEGAARLERVADQTANSQAYLVAGQTRFSMGQFDLARHDADAAKRINSKLAGLATLNGMILEQTSDYDGAEVALLQALAENPDDFNAHFYLGAIFYFKRDMPKARTHLMRALQLQPTSAQVRYELALVHRAEGNLNQALQELEEVVRQIPDWLQPHVELSSLYYRLHRPEDGAREKQLVDRMLAAQQQAQASAAR